MRWWFFGISCTTLFWNQKESKKLETKRRGSEVSKVSLKMTGIVRYKDVFADTLPAHDFRFLANPPLKKRRGHGWCWWSGTSHPSWFQVICKTEKSDSDGDLSRMLYINCNMASNRQITQNHPGLVWVIEMFIFLAFWRWWGCEPPRKKTYRFSARTIGIRWPLKKQNRGPRACPNRA